MTLGAAWPGVFLAVTRDQCVFKMGLMATSEPAREHAMLSSRARNLSLRLSLGGCLIDGGMAGAGAGAGALSV